MPENDAVPEITPRELAHRLAAGEDFDLIDVREPHEWDIAHIDGRASFRSADSPARSRRSIPIARSS